MQQHFYFNSSVSNLYNSYLFWISNNKFLERSTCNTIPNSMFPAINLFNEFIWSNTL